MMAQTFAILFLLLFALYAWTQIHNLQDKVDQLQNRKQKGE
jgi:type II secretory pathway component PulL